MQGTDAPPQLDGSFGTTVARLEHFSESFETYATEDRFYAVRSNIEEAQGLLRTLASVEECTSETCSKAGEVEYLASELSNALTALNELEEA